MKSPHKSSKSPRKSMKQTLSIDKPFPDVIMKYIGKAQVF